ncbi:hypothetical protein EVA_07285 [gut metagenome]|uniref:Uncharacterized protein n=1 Tax=gut metagenome TaxID=749906 RepID=J9GQ96_9ZZZZ
MTTILPICRPFPLQFIHHDTSSPFDSRRPSARRCSLRRSCPLYA